MIPLGTKVAVYDGGFRHTGEIIGYKDVRYLVRLNKIMYIPVIIAFKQQIRKLKTK